MCTQDTSVNDCFHWVMLCHKKICAFSSCVKSFQEARWQVFKILAALFSLQQLHSLSTQACVWELCWEGKPLIGNLGATWWISGRWSSAILQKKKKKKSSKRSNTSKLDLTFDELCDASGEFLFILIHVFPFGTMQFKRAVSRLMETRLLITSKRWTEMCSRVGITPLCKRIDEEREKYISNSHGVGWRTRVERNLTRKIKMQNVAEGKKKTRYALAWGASLAEVEQW